MIEMTGVDRATFQAEVAPLNRPVVLRGLVADWPSVHAGRDSPAALAAYLKRFDSGGQVEAFLGDPSIKGRFWYRDDMRGLNYRRGKAPLVALVEELIKRSGEDDPPALYAGAAPIADVLPGFGAENAIALVAPDVAPRIWLGNAVTVSTHYDLSDNIACVIAGRRRFTLIPPEQLANLYVGPLEFTFAGQPVSMVDLENPELDRYPRFKDALASAQTAVLEPGDAIYIPTLWWHHVRSLAPFNALVNYWWVDGITYAGSPFEALIHAIMTIPHLPPARRAQWRMIFDHYVFRPDGAHPAAHLAAEHRGVLGEMTPRTASRIKTWLLNVLER